MFYRFSLFLLIAGGLFLTACGNKATDQQQESTGEQTEQAEVASGDWVQLMDAFHDPMSGTFHPVEEGNLAPLRERYQELIQGADAWAAAAMPEKFQGKNLEPLLAQLQEKTKALGQLVENNASDQELTDAITAVHDVYHSIVGACEDEH